MIKVDATVKRETKYIAYFCTILSVLMQAVFVLLKRWDYTVILGNLLSLAVAVLNFLFMGIGIQMAVKKDEKDAKATLKLSQGCRMLLLLVVLVIGVVAPYFNMWAVVIPMIFPRIAIAFRPLLDKGVSRN